MAEADHAGGGARYLHLAPGTTLRDGRYVLERRLGSGGMAAVWLASDELLGRAVAIKLMSETIVDEPAWVERFRREARVAASLSHPNLVEVYDFEPTGPRPFLVMAHVPGGTLAERLADGDPPEPRRLGAELLAALTHMHAAGVLHRDVKSSNVMMGADGSARLGDFGIARPRGAPAVTATGQVLGSASYMAPEVMAGEGFTERADLYSTGVVLRELLRVRPDPGLDPLVAEMTEDAPELRPATARRARQRIEASLDGDAERTAPRPVEADPPPEPPASGARAPFEPPVIAERRRGGARAAAIVAVLAVLVAVAAVALLSLNGGDGGGPAATNGGGSPASASGSGSGSESSGSGGSNPGSEGSGSSPSGSGSGSAGPRSGTRAVVPTARGTDPGLAASLDMQGRSLIDSGSPAEAIPILRRAVVASDPASGDTYAFALYNLGNALRLAGRPAEAVEVLEARLQVDNQLDAVQAELDLAIADAGLD